MDHEHGGHGGHGGGGNEEASCPMIMVFHGGHCERILWKSWLATTVTQFVLSAVAIFAIAFIYETIKYIREQHLRQAARKEAERMALELRSKSTSCASANGVVSSPELRDKSYLERIFGPAHLIQSLLNLVQLTISYLLMLVFMTYNYWLCLAVVMGLGVGYFFFGWVKQNAYETECCN